MSEFPDLTQKALGFRKFKVVDGGFCSIGIGTYHWLPGPNRARCLAQVQQSQSGWSSFITFSFTPSSGATIAPSEKPATHAAPDAECHCGLYGLHSFDPLWLNGSLAADSSVAAAILGWGTMEVHRSGFRSEFAELAMVGYDPLVGVRKIAEIREAAQLYGVRAVPIDELESAGSQMGERIPEALLPEIPEPAKTKALPSSVVGSSGAFIPPMYLTGMTSRGDWGPLIEEPKKAKPKSKKRSGKKKGKR